MKTRLHRGTAEESRALGAYVKLMRAANSVTARIHRHLADAHLTVSQFGVIEALYHLGPLTQGEIARKILKTSGNVTLVIDNLEKRGLVARMHKQRDRRCFVIHLEEKGRRLMNDLFPPHASRIIREMNVLTSKEQEELARLCKKLGLGADHKKR